MIKKFLLSKYRREPEELDLRIKACENLKDNSPDYYNKAIENYKDRIEQHKSKINNIVTFTLTDCRISTKQNFAKFWRLFLIILLFIGISYLRPAIIGYVTEVNSVHYAVEINKTFSNHDTYIVDIGKKWSLTS